MYRTFLNHNGFSLVELILSAGALGFFALLVQSMLLLGHSFTKSQQNLFESFTTARIIKQNICMINSAFNNVNIDSKNSYSREEKLCKDGTEASCDQITNPNPPPALIPNKIYSRKYIQLDTTDPKSLMGIDISGLTIDSTLLASASQNIQEDGSTPVFYKVYQDSHTLARLNVNMAAGGVSDLSSAYIFASRCVKNDKDSVHNNKATFNPNLKAQSAMKILTENRRPFYFPSNEKTDKNEVIQCCKGLDSNKEPTNCESAIDKWLPRIYVIHISPVSTTPAIEPDDGGFPVQVSHIQEFPELQDINTFWGIGFVLSMDNKTIFSQSAFQLDTLVLKNTCSTSATNIQKCADMAVGDDPKVKELIGIKKTMDHFLISNISSCAGYSSGVDTTGLMRF